MGVIITSHRNIIFWLICAALVSLLFFVCGYMLGKSSVVDPNARIAMILPVEDMELNQDSGERETDLVHSSEDNQQVAESKNKVELEKKEQIHDEKKVDIKEKSAQPDAKKKDEQKPQPETQQSKNKNLKEQKITTVNASKKETLQAEVTDKVVADKKPEPQLTLQTEKPVGARYSIQVEAFGIQRNADKFLVKIKQKYPSAHIFKNKAKKRLPLAVRIGYFKSYRKALEAAKVFEAKEKRSAMVVKIGK